MNEKEQLAKMEYRLQLVEKNQGQLESAFQIVWAWLIANKGFCDKLPFTTIKPKEEPKSGLIVPETPAAPAESSQPENPQK